MAVTKKKVIKSLDNLSEDLRELMKKQYPLGYENSITRINNAKKEPIFVFPLETDEATYLVKIPATKNSEGEYDVDSKPKDPEFGAEEKSDEEGFGATDDFGGDDDYGDEEGGESRSKDPSYEPDFDN
jgi:hypothetical protein